MNSDIRSPKTLRNRIRSAKDELAKPGTSETRAQSLRERIEADQAELVLALQEADVPAPHFFAQATA